MRALVVIGALLTVGCAAGHFVGLDIEFSPAAYDSCMKMPAMYEKERAKGPTVEEACYRYAKTQYVYLPTGSAPVTVITSPAAPVYP